MSGASPGSTSRHEDSTNYYFRELPRFKCSRHVGLCRSPGVTWRHRCWRQCRRHPSGYRTMQRGDQNRVMIDGLVTTEAPALMASMSIRRVRRSHRRPAGHAPTWATRVQTQMMIKSGGNQSMARSTGLSKLEPAGPTSLTSSREGHSRQEVNRMKVYYDFNGDAGGYGRKTLSGGTAPIASSRPRSTNRAPGESASTKLRHFSGKTTFSLPSENKIIGSFMRTLKIQPTRLDARRATNPINLTEGSTQGQRHWAWVYKAEWNKVLSDSTFGEVRGGQFGYNWPLVPNANATGPRIEDLSNSLVSGPNLHRQQNRRRNQVLGSISYFKEGFGGSHDLKFGGEVFHETFFRSSCQRRTALVGVVSAQRRPLGVELPDAGAIEATLMTYSFFANDTWRVNNGSLSRRACASIDSPTHYRTRASRGPIQQYADCVCAVDDW